MNKGINRKYRADFVKKAIKDPSLAARDLKDLAIGLEHCRNTTDIINALCVIFSVSERTIFRDLIS